MDEQSILVEQQRYYRARAAEYDEWWLREGRFDQGPEANAQWWKDVETVVAALREFEPSGRILELAGGTGRFSQELLTTASELTIVDASPEMLELNRSRLRSSKVQYVEADIFDWTPTTRYDTVFFSFWLSHVPGTRFEIFWDLVRSSLAPAGRVFFIDSLRVQSSTATDHTLPDDTDVMTRKLNDGREFDIFKVYYEPADLEQRLTDLGWQPRICAAEQYFLYGECVRGDD